MSTRTLGHTPLKESRTAEEVVRVLAAEVGINSERLDNICNAMRDELIEKSWQLEFIDSSQWREMGVPIGLVAAVRRWTSDVSSSVPPAKGPTVAVETDDQNESSTMLPEKRSFSTKASRAILETRFQDDDDLTNNPENRPEAPPSEEVYIENPNRHESRKKEREAVKMPSTMEKIRALLAITKPLDWIMPFDHQMAYKRGVLHAMSSEHLQRYFLNIAELWFVFLALFVGSALALWEAYPDTPDEPKYGMTAVAFNSIMLLAVQACMSGVALFGVVYVVSSAIHPKRYKKFCLFVMRGVQVAENLLIVSWYLFFVLLLMVVHLRNDVIISETGLRVNSTLITVVLAVVFVGINLWVAHNLNVLGRFAFHGEYMCLDRSKERDSVTISRTKASNAVEFECEVMRTALDGINMDTEDILNKSMLHLKWEKRSLLGHKAKKRIAVF